MNEFKDQAVRFVFESIEPTDTLRWFALGG